MPCVCVSVSACMRASKGMSFKRNPDVICVCSFITKDQYEEIMIITSKPLIQACQHPPIVLETHHLPPTQELKNAEIYRSCRCVVTPQMSGALLLSPSIAQPLLQEKLHLASPERNI